MGTGTAMDLKEIRGYLGVEGEHVLGMRGVSYESVKLPICKYNEWSLWYH